MITIDGDNCMDAFVELNEFNKAERDVPNAEEVYAKWLEIVNGIMKGKA